MAETGMTLHTYRKRCENNVVEPNVDEPGINRIPVRLSFVEMDYFHSKYNNDNDNDYDNDNDNEMILLTHK